MRATVTSKGQITIPQAVRAKVKITSGSQLEFQVKDDNTIVVHLVSHEISDLKGMVKSRRKKPPTLGEMKDAISAGATSKTGKQAKL
jgi:AbrB family looped-hinge helix DNA binding protein